MKALTAAEIGEVERLTTERFGISGLQLMEAAGKSTAEVFLEQYGFGCAKPPGRACVLCGKGNNGGGGVVVARYLLEEGEQGDVYLYGEAGEVRGRAATLSGALRSGKKLGLRLPARKLFSMRCWKQEFAGRSRDCWRKLSRM